MTLCVGLDLLILQCFHLFFTENVHKCRDAPVKHKLHLHIFIRSNLKEINFTRFEGKVNVAALHVYFEEKTEKVDLLYMFCTFFGQLTECYHVSIIVDQIHFKPNHLTNHQDFVSADLMARYWHSKVKNVVGDDLATMETHDHEFVLRYSFPLFRVCL